MAFGNNSQPNVANLVQGGNNVQSGSGTVADLVRMVGQMQNSGGGGSGGGKMSGFPGGGAMFPPSPLPGPRMPFTPVQPQSGNWAGGSK